MRPAAFPTLILVSILGAGACYDSGIDHVGSGPTELATTAVPPAGVPATTAQATADLAPGSCHFGNPVEIDEYNGLVYVHGGRHLLDSPGQVVDMWGLLTELIEMPDDISWTCNPEEMEHGLVPQLVAHDGFPDDIVGFSLVQIHDMDHVIPEWYLAYRLPVTEEDLVPEAFRKRMVLKLWNPHHMDSLADSVQVTVTACLDPAFKYECILN